ncbi:hypothetical protein ACYSUW_14005 [Pseudomonas frederiksbergensis]
MNPEIGTWNGSKKISRGLLAQRERSDDCLTLGMPTGLTYSTTQDADDVQD